MDKGPRRVSKPLGSPQKFRPGGPPKKMKAGALGDPLLLSPDVLDDATRRELLQDVLRPRRASPSSMERSPAPAASANVNEGAHPDKEPFANQLRARVRAGSQNSDDLLTAMAARLKEVESKHKAYQSELQELHTKYRQLNDRYQRERQLREEAETAVLTLYDEKELLEQHLADLESGTATPRAEGKAAGSGGDPGRAPSAKPAANARSSGTSGQGNEEEAISGGEKFDLFSGDFNEMDAEKVAPTHFTNTARPGTLLFSPQKTRADAGTSSASQHAVRGNTRRHSAATVDVALLKKNARILSDYVGWKGVVKNGKQGGIRERDVVHVVVYKNGICVNRGPFRPYGWALCDAFLDDLTEGYYPYEFKEKYPEGFPIEVTDFSTENCEVDANGAARAKAAAGKKDKDGASPSFPTDGGRRLGGTPLAAGQPRPIHTLQDCNDGGGYTPVSAAAFLSKVPAQRVTASGQLVSVRDDVAALMGVKGSAAPNSHDDPSNTVKRAAAADAAIRRAKAHLQEQKQHPPTPASHEVGRDSNKAETTVSGSSSVILGNLIAVLVRLPNGRKVTLHMAPEDTVETLRQEFVAAAPQFAHTPYELCQAYPVKCVWGDHRRTLGSFGIRKTCTLMVRLK